MGLFLPESVVSGMTMIEVSAAVIWRGDRFLICQRPEHKEYPLQWEFPGGKVKSGETAEECIVRECREEFGVTLRPFGEFFDTVQEQPERMVHIHFFSADIICGEVTPLEHKAVAWVTTSEVKRYALSPADEEMLRGIDVFCRRIGMGPRTFRQLH